MGQQQDDNFSNAIKMVSSSNADLTTAATLAKKKELYLLTDDGFLKKLLINLVSISLLVFATLSFPLFKTPAVHLYNFLTDWMLNIAHRNAWWFLLATLSSSCCVLQLLLNALSVGCAGFNTVLGPLRPTFLAISVLSQGMSWYVALRVLHSPQWSVSLGSSFVMVVLSLFPEILAFYTQWRKGSNGRNDTKQGADNNKDTNQIVFDMGTSVGCAACVNSISGLLDGLSVVTGYDVSVDDNRLKIRCKIGTDPKIILNKLRDGGYSMTALK